MIIVLLQDLHAFVADRETGIEKNTAADVFAKYDSALDQLERRLTSL